MVNTWGNLVRVHVSASSNLHIIKNVNKQINACLYSFNTISGEKFCFLSHHDRRIQLSQKCTNLPHAEQALVYRISLPYSLPYRSILVQYTLYNEDDILACNYEKKKE